VAYKQDTNDLRDSPALDIIRLLQEKGAEVCYQAPYVPEVRSSDSSLTAIEVREETLAKTG
jgi:UDP-N-acetyl-D-glucosamine dehydrogenase